MLIHPTLINFKDQKRSAEVMIVNRGDATGVFEVSWVDYSMTPTGGLKEWDTPAPWSLQPYVRYSPRRISLRPGETQVIKIALRRSQEISEGEYLSHLKVLTINDNADEANAEKSSSGVTIKTRTGMTIPVIWRNSSATPEAVIHPIDINLEQQNITIDVQRLGALSVRGYLHVIHQALNKQRKVIADPLPLVIYQNLDKRTISITLKPDAAISAATTGNIEIFYSEDLQNPEPSIASYKFKL